jgi:transposase
MAQPLKTAQHLGNLRQVKSLLARLALLDGQRCAQVAVILRVHEKTVPKWVGVCCCEGLQGAPRQQPPGRPPTLTPTPHAARAPLMDEGPGQAGGSGACWRSPLRQQLIDDRGGVFYHVCDIAQVLKHWGVSCHKAALVSDHLAADNRQAGRTTTWPQLLRRAQAPQALLRFGDAASVPQWGTRTSTWARRGQQPQVTTCGKRKGYQVFGLIDSFTGPFLSQGREGRRHSAASLALLRRVLAPPPPPLSLMQDGAKSHSSAATQAFFAQQRARLQVVPLPTSAPD